MTAPNPDVIGYHLIRNWEKYLIFAAGIGLGWKPTRGATRTAVRWTATSVIRPIAVGVGIATANVLRVVALPIITGGVIGATVGTVIAGQIWGEQGKRDALELYTGKVSWDEYWSTLDEGFSTLWE